MLYKKKPLPGTSDDTSYLVTQENAFRFLYCRNKETAY